MATPEAKVKRKIDEWLDRNMPGLWSVKPRGGPFGKTGCPDILVCWHGFFVAIEVKSLEGDTTPMQMIQLKAITKAGGVAAVVRGYDVPRLEKIKELVLAKLELLKCSE
jgi:hypothetical protein